MKPILINNIEVAKNQESIDGEIAIVSYERLADILEHNVSGTLMSHYKLSGSMTKLHLPSLQLSVNVTLPVICQRCLNAMQLKLSLSHDYVVSESEPKAFDGDDDIDWLETSREMNLNELIEDELLMAIPLAPTHDHDCKPLKQESGEKHNPFAALKGLIK